MVREKKSEKTPEQRKREHERLMAARESALGGCSPRALGEHRAAEALEWVYRWGWSSPTMLDSLSGGSRRGLTARLVRSGLLVATKTEAGGVLSGVPMSLITLSKTGLEEVESQRSKLLEYRLDPHRIWQGQLRHDLIAQQMTLNCLTHGEIDSYQTLAEQKAKSAPAVKQPDVVWHKHGGGRIGVEVELSARWGRQLDQFVRATILSMSKTAGDQALTETQIITYSTAIALRYRQAFEAGKAYWIWTKNEKSAVWKRGEKREVPAWVQDKMSYPMLYRDKPEPPAPRPKLSITATPEEIRRVLDLEKGIEFDPDL